MKRYTVRASHDWSGTIRYPDGEFTILRQSDDSLGSVSAWSIDAALVMARSIFGHNVVVSE